MTVHQTTLFEKARKALDSARLVLDAGDPNAAINRAFYASYYAATAALLEVNEAPKTHAGAQRLFFVHFVNSGRIGQSIGETFRFASNMRQRADYDAFTVYDAAAAEDLIADVERFVEVVEAVLEQDQE